MAIVLSKIFSAPIAHCTQLHTTYFIPCNRLGRAKIRKGFFPLCIINCVIKDEYLLYSWINVAEIIPHIHEKVNTALVELK